MPPEREVTRLTPMLQLFQGIAYGFAGGIQPGPFQAYTISQTLRNGWRRTLPIALAPLISDPPIILLVLLVLSRIPDSLRHALHLASGVFIIYLAYRAFSRWRGAITALSVPPEKSPRGLLQAVVMNLISPGPYIYWSLVAGPAQLAGWQRSPRRGLAFLLGFYSAVVGTFAAIIVLFGSASQLGPRINRALVGISALALLGFGLYQLWLGFSGWLSA